jgi:hypothetical protein
VLGGWLLASCSSVNILQPADGSTFTVGQTVDFEGEVTRSSETGGEDRSDDLVWDSSRDGNLGTGRTLSLSTLSEGSHRITASWASGDEEDSITIQVNR